MRLTGCKVKHRFRAQAQHGSEPGNKGRLFMLVLVI
jgi:hypothetical protein